jgi:hypothetical protein
MTPTERARYSEGRLARARGQARALPDGRCSGKTRAAFYAGWDAEDLIRQQRHRPLDAASPEEIGEFKAQALKLLSA